MARVFPGLPTDLERRLEAVKMVSAVDPEYFKDPTCPYKWLAHYLRPAVLEGDSIRLFSQGQSEEEGVDTVLGEVQGTIEEMKRIEQRLATDDVETSDRIAFFKAKTAMLEKWTSLKERLINMKSMSEFQKIVVSVMEEVMDTDQQQALKIKLKGLMG